MTLRLKDPDVVIVGAGFGGLRVARDLRDAPVNVTVIDQRNHHTFQPLLYQVATAGLDSDDICYASRGVFHRQRNARAIQATVTGVDYDARLVLTADGDEISYDVLVLAAGAVTADFDVPGVADYAFGLKSAAEAMQIRNHVLRGFERAARSDDAHEQQAATSVVIVGGGPTGVEMAGGFAELFDRVLRRDFPEIDQADCSIVLVEGQDRLLATFDPRLSDKAAKRLKQMGVRVLLGTQVSQVGEHHVDLSDRTRLATNNVVWAAGVRAHPLARAIGLETAAGGRVVVDEHLRVRGHPSVFAIGDLAAVEQGDGSLVPQVAPGAIQGGQHVASVVQAMVTDKPEPTPFRYRDKGSMATIGRNAAVVELPNGMRVSGFLGWVAWLGLHLIMLIGFRNRANVLVNWAWNWLTYDRGSRIVIDDDVYPFPTVDRTTFLRQCWSMINGFHTLIYSDDAAATRAFFRDVLEWPSIDAGDGWLIFKTKPAELGVHPTGGHDGEASGNTPLHQSSLMCDDIEATVADLRAKGVQVAADIVDEGFGLTTMITVPGAGEMMLYQARHELAHQLAD